MNLALLDSPRQDASSEQKKMYFAHFIFEKIAKNWKTYIFTYNFLSFPQVLICRPLLLWSASHFDY
jgi:hypothetical protein